MIKNVLGSLVMGLTVIGGIVGVGAGAYVKYENTSYKNAIRYAEEHNIKCYAKGPNIAYVYSDGTILGRDVVYQMYK